MTTPLQSSSDAPQVFAFTDAEQRGWEVRAIRDPLLPERRARFLNPAYAGGWLLFTCGEERRRYAPLPPDWSSASESRKCSGEGSRQPDTFRSPGEPSGRWSCR